MSLRSRGGNIGSSGGGGVGGDKNGPSSSSSSSNAAASLPRPGVNRTASGKSAVGPRPPPAPPIYQANTTTRGVIAPTPPYRQPPTLQQPQQHHPDHPMSYRPPVAPAMPTPGGGGYGGGIGGGANPMMNGSTSSSSSAGGTVSSPFQSHQRPTYQYQVSPTMTTKRTTNSLPTTASTTSSPREYIPSLPATMYNSGGGGGGGNTSSSSSYGGYNNNNSSNSTTSTTTNNNNNNMGGYGAPTGSDYAFVNRTTNNNNIIGDGDDKYTKKKTQSSSSKRRGAGQSSSSSSSNGTTGSTTTILGIVVVILGLVYSMAVTTFWLSSRGQTQLLYKEVGKATSVKDVITHIKSLQSNLKLKEQQLSRSDKTAQTKVTQQVNTLERENRLLIKERDVWKKKHEESVSTKVQDTMVDRKKSELLEEKLVHHETQHHKFTRREAAFLDQVQWLMATTRRESKRSVLEKYVYTHTTHNCVWDL
jgi:hypothetical protein